MVDVVKQAGVTTSAPVPTRFAANVRDARVVLDHNRYSWIWVVPACPYCGKQHDHYAGPLDGDPSMYLGMRYAAHCNHSDRRWMAAQVGSENLWYVLVAAYGIPATSTQSAEQLVIGSG